MKAATILAEYAGGEHNLRNILRLAYTPDATILVSADPNVIVRRLRDRGEGSRALLRTDSQLLAVTVRRTEVMRSAILQLPSTLEIDNSSSLDGAVQGVVSFLRDKLATASQ